ncbi:MAG: peptide-methionine (S)-S-oxide reductase MsrA, partial [Erysipelotrichaceae bacterium]|nr:peptide-methionine (S)-S-oxide reductase MsrA [Erysipelotrichaceae bacterium]
MKVIYLAGGCFWGVQKYLNQFKGVTNTVVGYANGHTVNPTYQEVKSQNSGHSETVKVEYDENIITLEKLLDYFYRVIDPTSLNKQGEDEGISYRTGIYYIDEEDKEVIHKVTSKVQD